MASVSQFKENIYTSMYVCMYTYNITFREGVLSLNKCVFSAPLPMASWCLWNKKREKAEDKKKKTLKTDDMLTRVKNTKI